MSSKDSNPRVTGKETIAGTKWLSLETITYNDENGDSRLWNCATRTTKKSGKADAVVIVPLLKKGGQDGKQETILVEQFRPPVGTFTMEFPAGLIDAGETPEQAALRELKEETGFIGTSCATLPKFSRPVCMSPGLTDESVHTCVVEVDLDDPRNQNPQPAMEETEFIKIHRVPLAHGLQQMLDQGSAMPIEGLYLFALGLEFGKTMSVSSK